MKLLVVKIFLPIHQTVQYQLLDILDLFKIMFNMHPLEVQLVNNKIHMHINKLPILMRALLKANNMLVSDI